jgi:hypothetical protein
MLKLDGSASAVDGGDALEDSKGTK